MRFGLEVVVLVGLAVISNHHSVLADRPAISSSLRNSPQTLPRNPPQKFKKSSSAGVLPRGGGNAEGKATITASVFNLVNNVAGAGILTLAAGMASGSGWIPAILICAVLGALSGHSFAIIGDACELTGEADFKVSTILDSFPYSFLV